jgi:predicted MFS family arabinose efflux permease
MNKALKVQVMTFTGMRLLLNVLFRMVYPFLPDISRGLGISFAQASHALSLRSISGIVGPFLAIIADRKGRKLGMLMGLLSFMVGLALVIFWPSLTGFILMLLLTTLGKTLFDAAVHAYIGDNVDYQQRGLVVAVTEMSWSGSYFIGMPLAAFLIARAGWMAPFPLLLFMLVVSSIFLYRMLPKSPGVTHTTPVMSNISVVFKTSVVWAGLLLTMFITMANEMVSLVFSVWLEGSFGLKVAAIGGVAALIGLSELSGEGLVTMISDRLGKRRAVALGLLCNSLAAILLSWVGRSIPGALAGLFLFYLSFEFSIVSAIPLITETLPSARATVLALSASFALLGRGVSGWLVPYAYAHSFAAITYSASAINLLALLSLSFVVVAADRKQHLRNE